MLFKFVVIMKLSFLLILMSILQARADVHAQGSITLTMQQTEIAKVLNKIEKRGEFRFLYNYDLPSLRKKVNVNFQNSDIKEALAGLFSRRLEYPGGSIEPQIIASAFVAAWRVAVYGFANMVAAGVDPPAPDEIGTQAFDSYTKGLEHLWTRPKETERHYST